MSSLLVGQVRSLARIVLSFLLCVCVLGGRGKAPLKRTSRLPLSHGQRNFYCSTSRNVVEDGAHNFSWQESTKKNCLKWITTYLETRIHLFQYVLIISLTQHCLVYRLLCGQMSDIQLVKEPIFFTSDFEGLYKFHSCLEPTRCPVGMPPN